MLQMVEHPHGNYRFLPGISPYSCGVVANTGFEIVQAVFHRPVAYQAAFQQIAHHLELAGRPQAALCAVALRCPQPYSFDGFAAFNREYSEILQDWGLFVGRMNPVARTNVAPMLFPPSEPVIYSFSYTRPRTEPGTTFVVAGAGELPEGELSANEIVARGDTSIEGLRQKAAFVMNLMLDRLRGLEVEPADVGVANVYTRHAIRSFLFDVILAPLGEASLHGVGWHLSQPPVAEIEFEMDMRRTRVELRLE